MKINKNKNKLKNTNKMVELIIYITNCLTIIMGLKKQEI